MAYLDVGEGEVLLFGHSYLWDHQMWAPQVAALSQRYRCIVPDFGRMALQRPPYCDEQSQRLRSAYVGADGSSAD